jgi:HEAT repeat protein
VAAAGLLIPQPVAFARTETQAAGAGRQTPPAPPPMSAAQAQQAIAKHLEEGKTDEALKTYDAYVAASKRPDAPMLANIARTDLRRIWQAKPDQPILLASVLERLARDGDAAALKALKQASARNPNVSPEELAPTVSLARLKDQDAITKLTQLLAVTEPLARAQVVKAIEAADVRSLAPSLIALLGDDSIVVRQAAALALGTLQSKESIPHLQATFEGDVPAVKMFAAVSLKRLGQANVDTFLAGLLNGQIAELRVIAAGAYQSTGPVAKNPTWEKAVRELMASPNEQHRLQAAEMLACCDAVAARTALTSALASANPLLRAGAAKIFEARRELADLTIARRIVGDALDPVRVYGNGLALVLAKDAASAPARGRGAAAGVSTNR